MPPRRQGRHAPRDYRFPPQAPVPPFGAPMNEIRQPPPRHFNNNEDDLPPSLKMSRPTIKVKIDEFIGDFNPSTFLDWKQATEYALDSCEYDEYQKVLLATMQFKGAARS